MIPKRARAPGWAFLFAMSPALLVAQAPPPTERQVRAGRETMAAETSDPTTLFSPLRSSASLVTLTGTTSEKTVDARIGWWQGQNSSLLFKASGPIDKSSGTGLLADLDGLRSAATVGIAFSRRFWKPSLDVDELLGFCKELGGEVARQGGCSQENLQRLHPDRVAEADRFVRIGNPTLIGASFEVGRKSFEVVDSLSLAASKSTETVFGLKIGVGHVVTKQRLWFGLLYRYERSFDEGEKTEVCRTIAGGAGTRCDEVVLQSPEEKRRSLLTGEFRHFLSDGFAVNVKLHVDLSGDVLGVEFPLYFLARDGEGLTGGISLGVRTDADEFVAQFFVGPVLGYSLF